jgi:hypothetical protein
MIDEPQMPVAHIPELMSEPGTAASDDRPLSGGWARNGTVTKLDEHRPPERKAEDGSKAAIESCVRTGQVMKALFPEGLRLQDDSDFAVYRLFDRLVGDVVHFAQSGMTQSPALRDISLHAMLLQNVIATRHGE